MQPLLIGIDPLGEVKDEIYKLKNMVNETCGQQEQAKEPPHLTFVVNNFTRTDEVDKILQGVASKTQPIHSEISGIGCFPPGQTGTYMLHAAIAKNAELERLQKNVVEETAGFRQGCLLGDYLRRMTPAYKFTEQEAENIKNFGFPYAGDNWIPHMTIAFLSPDAYEKIRGKLEAVNFKYGFELECITLFTRDDVRDIWVPSKNYRLGD